MQECRSVAVRKTQQIWWKGEKGSKGEQKWGRKETKNASLLYIRILWGCESMGKSKYYIK
jgi:hypothetical protein